MALVTGTKVLPCGCESTYQDKKYGRGNRLHNLGPKVNKGTGEQARCTVCGREK